jgi:ribosomal protein L16 Arg81 hydroxylase
MYFGNRLSDWHYDGHDNFLYLLQGTKTVYLAAPSSIKSRSIFSLFNNHYDNKSCNSSLLTNKTFKARITSGRCLFIPKGWWHKVYSQGNPSIAINFWINSLTEVMRNFKNVDKKLLLKQLLFEVADKYC